MNKIIKDSLFYSLAIGILFLFSCKVDDSLNKKIKFVIETEGFSQSRGEIMPKTMPDSLMQRNAREYCKGLFTYSFPIYAQGPDVFKVETFRTTFQEQFRLKLLAKYPGSHFTVQRSSGISYLSAEDVPSDFAFTVRPLFSTVYDITAAIVGIYPQYSDSELIVKTESWYCSPVGGGGGSGGGGTGEGGSGDGDDGPFVGHIDNQVTDSCIRKLVGAALIAKTSIRIMLNNTFAGQIHGDKSIIFTDVTYLTDNISGIAIRESDTYYVIKLNKNTLPGMSKEYGLATVYHEILHVFLMDTYPKDPEGKFILPMNQHEDMADKYVALLTGMLRIAFPGISDQEAWGLAWGGLEETNYFNTKLTAQERALIIQVNTNSRKSAPAGVRLGHYCQ